MDQVLVNAMVRLSLLGMLLAGLRWLYDVALCFGYHPQQFFYAMKSLAGMHIMNQTLICSMPKHITSNRSFLEVNKNCFPHKTHALFIEL